MKELGAGIRFDHLGIAVESLEESLRRYVEGLGLRARGDEEVAGERVRVVCLPVGDGEIELIEATDPESSIARFIRERGPGIHHIAFRVANLEEALKRAWKAGLELVEGYPKTGAGGSLVAFLHPKSTGGVLIELCEKKSWEQTGGA